MKRNANTIFILQGSLYYQPKQCTIIGEIPQNHHRFALFDPPQIDLMTPVSKGVNMNAYIECLRILCTTILAEINMCFMFSLQRTTETASLLSLQFASLLIPEANKKTSHLLKLQVVFSKQSQHTM